jgi:hypothetical protein
MGDSGTTHSMHAVYLFKHSAFDDEELRFSMRSLAANAPLVEQVWILGDRPVWLGEDAFVRVVPHDEVAWLLGLRTPVVNAFLMHVLVALLPELPAEYLVLCDDYVFLGEYTEQLARRTRYVEDLSRLKSRGRGLWKDALWRTYETLRRRGYTSLNFETHTPVRLTKRRVLDAYRDLRDFVSQDRYYGLLAETAILNHALMREELDLVRRDAEGLFAGFYDRAYSEEEISERCAGKTFLNFDDHAFDDAMRSSLAQRFPEPAPWEIGRGD